MRSTYDAAEKYGFRRNRLSVDVEASLDTPAGLRKLFLLRRAEDLRPVLLALGFVSYQLLVFLFAADALEAFLLVAVPHFVLQVALMNVQHISIHQRLFHSWGLELGFCAVATLSLGFTRSCFALDHLAHHRHYLDPALDPNAWQRDRGALRRHRYALRHLLSVYPRTWRMARIAGPAVAAEYVAEAAIVLAWCTLLILAKPEVALAVFVYPMVYNILATYYWAHHQHADLDAGNPLLACRTFDSPAFNWLSFNVGYHTAHHYRPDVHWSKLPALHKALQERIPGELTLRSIPWLSSNYGTGVGGRTRK